MRSIGCYSAFGLLLIAGLLSIACTTRKLYEAHGLPPEPLPNAVNINAATVDELEALPHIGRKTAENILRFREANGPFRRPEYLLQIHGVSEKRFLEIQTLIRTE